MQNPNNQNLPRRYSVMEMDTIIATGAIIQFIPITEWPFLQAVLLVDSPQDRNGAIVSYPVNRIKALPTQEEANETLSQDKAYTVPSYTNPVNAPLSITLEEKYSKLIKSWNETIKELTYVKQHNEELRREIAANKEQFKTLTDSNDDLQKQVKDKESKLFKCANEILSLHDRIKIVEHQNYDLIKTIDSRDTKIKGLEHAMKDLVNNNQDLFDENEILSAVIAKQKQEIEELRINYTKKIENLKRQFRDIAFNS